VAWCGVVWCGVVCGILRVREYHTRSEITIILRSHHSISLYFDHIAVKRSLSLHTLVFASLYREPSSFPFPLLLSFLHPLSPTFPSHPPPLICTVLISFFLLFLLLYSSLSSLFSSSYSSFYHTHSFLPSFFSVLSLL
jgi:drug/metabolite transporter (DMT)-like permease